MLMPQGKCFQKYRLEIETHNLINKTIQQINN